MVIIDEVSESRFIQEFQDLRPNNFSYEGLSVLYNYLYDLSEDLGEPLRFDIIAICCDYSEYKDLKDFLSEGFTIDAEREDYEDEEDYLKAVEEEINDNTMLLLIGDDLNDGFIILNY